MKDVIKEADFRKELKGEPGTGYLFFGEEDYLKAFAVRSAKEVLCPDPSFSFFNEIRIDALDFEAQKLLDALAAMPMMAEKKLVTLSGLNFNAMRPNEIDDLCEVLERLPEYDYTLLIVTASADALNPGYLPKKPSPVFAKLAEHLTPVQFDRCTTAKLTAWVQKHLAHNGVEASPALCAAIPEYCGHSMFLLANEIDKLSYYVRARGETVATEEAMKKVCTPVTEYDAFAFANAIMGGKQEAALAILADYKFRRVDPLMILGDVIRVICDMVSVRAMSAEGTPAGEIASVLKLHEFKVGLYQKSLRQSAPERAERALKACMEADGTMKLSQAGYKPLEQLICKM